MNLARAISMDPSNHSLDQAGGRLVSTDGQVLPLERSHLTAEAGGGIARVILEQRFRNPHDVPLLVTYQLPLPDSGAVSGFSFRIGEMLVVGEVDRKHRARERFEQAIASGQTAALLEQERSSLFTQKVGNIPPGQEIVCEVVIDQPLSWLPEGAWEWRFPTVVGPRYMGAAGHVQDADRIATTTSAEKLAARLTLALTIDDLLVEGASPESSSHPLRSIERSGAHEVCFERDRPVRLDRDVVVRWSVATPEVGVTLDAARPSRDGHQDRAYGLLTIVPPRADVARMPKLARDLIFLIDTSGSMGGRPLDQAKRVVCAMIDTLGDDDRIELIEFGSRAKRWRDQPVAATRDGRREAMKWVRKLRSSGATQMHEAVLEALEPLRPKCQRQVVLITDGFIGFESDIVSAILKYLPENCRLHTIGVGSAPNRSLTRPAARAGAGVELIIGLDEDAERVAGRLLERTTAPLVTDLRIDGPAVLDVRPQRLPDLFAGSPVLVSVALAPGGGSVRVRGTMADGDFEYLVEAPEQVLGQGHQAVAALYGREWIEDLETHTAARGTTREGDAEIEQVGLDFQIASRMTSWIAVTQEATVSGDELIAETMPHEVPHGVRIEGFGLRGGQTRFSGAASTLIAGSASEEMSAGTWMQLVQGKAEDGPSDKMLMGASFAPPAPAPVPAQMGGVGRFSLRSESLQASMPKPLPMSMPSSYAKAQRRRTIWPLFVLLALLVALALGLWFWLSAGAEETAPEQRDDTVEGGAVDRAAPTPAPPVAR